MSSISSSSFSSGESTPESGRSTPEINDIESYKAEVHQQLDKFRPQKVQEFDNISHLLKTFINPEAIVETNIPAWLKQRSFKLLRLAEKAEGFTNPQDKESCKALLINELSRKIAELDALSIAERRKIAIANKFSRIIEKIIDALPLESLEDIHNVTMMLRNFTDFTRGAVSGEDSGAGFTLNLASRRLIPHTAKLNYIMLGYEADGIERAVHTSEDHRELMSQLYTKLSTKLDQLSTLSIEDKERLIAERLFRKEEANYIELINEHLDRFPVEKLEDFEINKNIWTSLLNESEIPLTISDKLKVAIGSLGKIMLEPELFVKPEHVERFKELVTQRIAKAIDVITQLSPREKVLRVAEYVRAQEEIARGRELLASARPPTVQQSTISYEEMIQMMGVTREQLQAILRDPAQVEQHNLSSLMNRIQVDRVTAYDYGVPEIYENRNFLSLHSNIQELRQWLWNSRMARDRDRAIGTERTDIPQAASMVLLRETATNLGGMSRLFAQRLNDDDYERLLDNISEFRTLIETAAENADPLPERVVDLAKEIYLALELTPTEALVYPPPEEDLGGSEISVESFMRTMRTLDALTDFGYIHYIHESRGTQDLRRESLPWLSDEQFEQLAANINELFQRTRDLENTTIRNLNRIIEASDVIHRLIRR